MKLIFCLLAPTILAHGLGKGPHVQHPNWNSELTRKNAPLTKNDEHKRSPSVSLHVTPTTVTSTPDGYVDITVTYTNPQESSCDWIGAFSPVTSKNGQYLAWFHVNMTSNKTAFRIWNVRDDYQFRYFNCHSDLLTVSETIKFTNPRYPCQGHIALTEKWNAMRLQWVSADVPDPIVLVSTSRDDLVKGGGRGRAASTMSFNAKGTTYNVSDMCQSTAATVDPRFYRDPGMIYDATMGPLSAFTTYYYQFGSKKYGMSEIYSFESSGPYSKERNDKQPMYFAVYGDQGVTPFPRGMATASNLNQEKNLDLVVHVGDISYARGQVFVWDIFGNMMAPIARRVPYMVSIGNHEYDHGYPVNGNASNKDPSGVNGTGFHPSWGDYENDSNGECGVPMFKRFHVPENGNNVFWYSFDFGAGHFVMITSEHNATKGTPLYSWLSKDLSSVNRTERPWVFVSIHRPLYMSENYPADNQVDLHERMEMEDLLLAHDVDVVFAGHFHAYQRSCFLKKGACVDQKDGILHLTVGMAGASLDTAVYEPSSWSKFADHNDFGYARTNLTSSEFCFSFVRNVDLKVVDDACVSK